MLRPSLRRTPESAPIKDSAGLPWGCCIMPLSPGEVSESRALDPILSDQVPRCTECFGYINVYCMFERKAWICSLCGCKNDLPQRYSSSTQRAVLEEMQRGIIDLLEDCVEVTDVYDATLKAEERPACIAVVDVSGSEDFVEMARSGILALLEALPGPTLFGLVTVSGSVGVYDMRHPFPRCYSVAVEEDGELAVPLADVLPLDCMLVQVATHKDRIVAAVESLSPAAPPAARAPAEPRGPGGGRAAGEGGGEGEPRMGLGSCLDALVGALEEDLQCSMRIVNIMGNRPNWGLGALGPDAERRVDAGLAGKTRATAEGAFYAKLAERVSQAGACVDLYVIGEASYLGLEFLAPLVQCGGGHLVLYPGLSTANLPRDLFRTYSRPYAHRGLLRLRCSSGFQVARAYGHLETDPQYENLHHVARCHSESCFAVDFEFTNPSGVTANLDVQPTIQLAFSYTVVVPVPADPAEEGADAPRSAGAYQVQRRLRLETMRVEMARQAVELYGAVDCEAMMCVLGHKMVRAIAEDGVKEACLLLQDWLVILVARYNEHIMRRRGSQLDVTMSKFGSLQPVPRFVYGMLRGRLLDPVLVTADERTYLLHLYSGLCPDALPLLAYPALRAFKSLDDSEPSESTLALHSGALSFADCPVFVLDAYTEILVHYTKAGRDHLPYPPPQDCGLRRHLQAVKESRTVCPQVLNTRFGDPQAEDFLARLIDDRHAPSAGALGGGGAGGSAEWAGAAAGGLDGFLKILEAEVAGFMEQD